VVALTRSGVKLISVPATEWVDRGYALVDMDAGELCIVDETPEATGEYDMRVTIATGTDAAGVVLKNVKAGGLCEFGKIGEVGGFVGLTPGAKYSIVDGEIDDTEPSITVDVGGTPTAIPLNAQFRARNEESIWFCLV
jgi:hypothetical protein